MVTNMDHQMLLFHYLWINGSLREAVCHLLVVIVCVAGMGSPWEGVAVEEAV